MKKYSFLFVLVVTLLQFGGLVAQLSPSKQFKGIEGNRRLIEATNVPQNVKDAQQKMFPNSQVEKWFMMERGPAKEGNVDGKGKPTIYVAKFKNTEGYETFSRITDAGEVRGYMTRLQGEKGLPTNIKDATLKRFQGYKIVASQKIHHLKGNKTAYRITLVQNSTRVITFVDENGNEVKDANLAPELKENIMDIPEKNNNNKE
jgi:hypothetical protein